MVVPKLGQHLVNFESHRIPDVFLLHPGQVSASAVNMWWGSQHPQEDCSVISGRGPSISLGVFCAVSAASCIAAVRPLRAIIERSLSTYCTCSCAGVLKHSSWLYMMLIACELTTKVGALLFIQRSPLLSKWSLCKDWESSIFTQLVPASVLLNTNPNWDLHALNLTYPRFFVKNILAVPSI